MEFKVGEQAVYPNCGVGVVQEIERIELGGEQTEMYVLEFPADKTRIWVPTSQAVARGMRPVMNKQKVRQTLDAISGQSAPVRPQTWNRRFRVYAEKIQTNDPQAMGEVLGELAAIKNEKTLSFVERKIYRRVHDLLVRELAAARNVEVTVIDQELEALIGAEH